MTNEFQKHLETASRLVASWPAWKQNVLRNASKSTCDVARKPVNNFAPKQLKDAQVSKVFGTLKARLVSIEQRCNHTTLLTFSSIKSIMPQGMPEVGVAGHTFTLKLDEREPSNKPILGHDYTFTISE